jgi:hypothetical protein
VKKSGKRVNVPEPFPKIGKIREQYPVVQFGGRIEVRNVSVLRPAIALTSQHPTVGNISLDAWNPPE